MEQKIWRRNQIPQTHKEYRITWHNKLAIFFSFFKITETSSQISNIQKATIPFHVFSQVPFFTSKSDHIILIFNSWNEGSKLHSIFFFHYIYFLFSKSDTNLQRNWDENYMLESFTMYSKMTAIRAQNAAVYSS